MCHCRCKFTEKTPVKALTTITQSMHTRKKSALHSKKRGQLLNSVYNWERQTRERDSVYMALYSINLSTPCFYIGQKHHANHIQHLCTASISIHIESNLDFGKNAMCHDQDAPLCTHFYLSVSKDYHHSHKGFIFPYRFSNSYNVQIGS